MNRGLSEVPEWFYWAGAVPLILLAGWILLRGRIPSRWGRLTVVLVGIVFPLLIGKTVLPAQGKLALVTIMYSLIFMVRSQRAWILVPWNGRGGNGSNEFGEECQRGGQ